MEGWFDIEWGSWKTSFAMNLGQCYVEEAEANGMLKGMKLVLEEGIRKVVVEFDSKIVAQFVTQVGKQTKVRCPIANII